MFLNPTVGLSILNRKDGKCGGYFKTGRILKFPPPTDLYSRGQTKTPLNGVYIGLANAMGIPITTFGDPIYGGVLPGLSG